MLLAYLNSCILIGLALVDLNIFQYGMHLSFVGDTFLKIPVYIRIAVCEVHTLQERCG
jgi:hypothetical protein